MGTWQLSISTLLIQTPQGTTNPALPRHFRGDTGVGICTQTWLLSDSGLFAFHSHALGLFTRMDRPLDEKVDISRSYVSSPWFYLHFVNVHTDFIYKLNRIIHSFICNFIYRFVYKLNRILWISWQVLTAKDNHRTSWKHHTFKAHTFTN